MKYLTVKCGCGAKIERSEGVVKTLQLRGMAPTCFDCKKKQSRLRDAERKTKQKQGNI